MALASEHGERFIATPVNPQPNPAGVVDIPPTIIDTPARTAVIDSQHVPHSNLVRYVTGTPYEVTYYRQLLGSGDEPKPQQLGVSSVHQQYECIKKLVLRITTAMVPDQDSDTKEFTLTGEANIFGGVIPNKGDMFVMTIGDGQAAVLTVTDEQRMAHTKVSVYRIEYRVVDKLTAERAQDLSIKTVRTYIYFVDLIDLRQSPLVTEEQYATLVNLENQRVRLAKLATSRFWAPDTHTLKVPQIAAATFDLYHADYCNFLGIGTISRDIKIYHNGEFATDAYVTIWTLLRDMDLTAAPYIVQRLDHLPAYMFKDAPVYRGVAYSPFDYTVFPHTTNLPELAGCSALHCDKEPTAPYDELLYEGNRLYAKSNENDSYVLSSAFYEHLSGDTTNSLTVLEVNVLKMLKKEPISAGSVVALCTAFDQLRPFDQFYYLPILMQLITYCRGSDVG